MGSSDGEYVLVSESGSGCACSPPAKRKKSTPLDPDRADSRLAAQVQVAYAWPSSLFLFHTTICLVVPLYVGAFACINASLTFWPMAMHAAHAGPALPLRSWRGCPASPPMQHHSPLQSHEDLHAHLAWASPQGGKKTSPCSVATPCAHPLLRACPGRSLLP